MAEGVDVRRNCNSIEKKTLSELTVDLNKLTEDDTCIFTDDASELSKLRLIENSASDKHIDRREQA